METKKDAGKNIGVMVSCGIKVAMLMEKEKATGKSIIATVS